MNLIMLMRCQEFCFFVSYADHMKIMYELISIDGWQRERSEGYAMQIVPFQAGKTSGRLPCYRNVSSSETIINRLERYFIGGRHTFHANAFHGISGGGDSEKVRDCSEGL